MGYVAGRGKMMKRHAKEKARNQTIEKVHSYQKKKNVEETKFNVEEQEDTAPFRLVGLVGFVTTVVFVLSVYVNTAFPSIAGGDSAEFVSEACVGGVAHPPGYPLFTIIIRTAIGFFSYPQFIPGRVASLICCVFGAFAAGFVSLSVFLLTARSSGTTTVIESMAAGMLFAFSPLVWEYSVGAEVFALNNFMAGILLLLTVAYVRTKSKMYAYTGALFCGLGLTNQHTIVLYEGPLILWILYIGRDQFNAGDLVKFTGLFLLGLTPYGYTYYASVVPTRGSWGNTSTLEGFLTHLLRKEYGTLKLSPMDSKNEGFWGRIIIYGEDSTEQFVYVGMLFAIVGLYTTCMHSCRRFSMRHQGYTESYKGVGFILLSTFLTYLVVFNYLANIPLSEPLPRAVHSRFWMQPNIIVAIWCGIGMHAVGAFLSSISKLAHFALRICVVALVLNQIWLNLDSMNQAEKGHVTATYGRAILDTLPKGAMLLSHTDINWNSVRYLQECEKLRPDVYHFSFQILPYPWFDRQKHLYPNVTFPPIFQGISTNTRDKGNTKLLLRFVEANIDSFPGGIFMDLHSLNHVDIGHRGKYFQFIVTPVGMLWKFERPQFASNITEWIEQSNAVFEAYSRGNDLPSSASVYKPGSWEYVAATIYWDGVYQRGIHLLGEMIEFAKGVSSTTFPTYMKGLHQSSLALFRALEIADTMGSISYHQADVLKNTALSAMRLYGAAVTAVETRLMPVSKDTLIDMKKKASSVISRFVTEVPNDRDAKAFKDFLGQLQASISQETHQ